MTHAQNPPSDEDFPLSPEFKIPEETDSLGERAEEALSSLPGVFDSAEQPVPFSEESVNEEPPSQQMVIAPPLLNPLLKVKQFSESATVAQTSIPAAFPFSLLIEGQLSVHEREKLLDLLSRENMGIREVDLEPQLESGRILIPRISEYAGVLLVQALRGTSAELKLGPSDSIFSTSDTQEENDSSGLAAPSLQYCSADSLHPAESLPVTTETELPGFSQAIVIDVVVATAALRTELVEAERSTEYQELLEALHRELKYKAYRKGAQGIVNYHWTLTPLSLPTHYRLTVSGTAVKSPSLTSPS